MKLNQFVMCRHIQQLSCFTLHDKYTIPQQLPICLHIPLTLFRYVGFYGCLLDLAGPSLLSFARWQELQTCISLNLLELIFELILHIIMSLMYPIFVMHPERRTISIDTYSYSSNLNATMFYRAGNVIINEVNNTNN